MSRPGYKGAALHQRLEEHHSRQGNSTFLGSEQSQYKQPEWVCFLQHSLDKYIGRGSENHPDSERSGLEKATHLSQCRGLLMGSDTARYRLSFGRKELMYSLQGQKLDQLLIQHIYLNLC
uniref:Uncharacterized protein n=1 Tax=Apteryx owenii TaxID=8824 RepID=A0A8B9PHZ3_APTOW